VPAPKITAIIPLFNGARTIEQALRSVFRQTQPAHEVIVVDDGSADAGPDIVQRLAAEHPLVLLRQPNSGQSAARNAGARHATGELLALLDQDDVWYPNHLAELGKPFHGKRPVPLGWAYSNLDEIDGDGRLVVRYALDACTTPHPKRSLFTMLKEDMFILPSATVLSRAAFDAVGGFDETLSGYEDDDLFLRLFQAGYDNVYIPEPLSQWRISSASASYSPRMARSRMVFARKLLAAYPDDPLFNRYYRRDMIAPRFLPQAIAEARRALRRGAPEEAEAFLDDVRLLRSFLPPGGAPGARKAYLISAVIALYNGAPFIEQALRSVFAQTVPPDEIIVVDDGSTDDGPEIVRRLAMEHPVRLLSKPNGGQSSARNLGVAHAHGDLIAFLDQDDLWYPNHLEALLEPFFTQRARELGWSYSNLDQIDRDGNMVARSFLSTVGTAHPKSSLQECLMQDMYVLPSASLVLRDAFNEVGGFDERLSGYEDDDLFLRIFRAGYENIYLNTPLSQWRIYTGSTSYSPRMAASRMVYARKLFNEFTGDPAGPQSYARDVIAPRFLTHMLVEYRNALARGSAEEMRATLENITVVAGHMRRRVRGPIMAAMPLLRIRPLARPLLLFKDLLRSLLRRGMRVPRTP